MSNDVVRKGPASFAPTNLKEAMEFAKLIADSAFVPPEYRGRPADILIAIQFGAEIGLSPMQALQSVSVINGKPAVWGDGALGIILASGLLETHDEMIEGAGDNRVGVCRVKRRGHNLVEKRFSVADAKKAGLWAKRGPWSSYPDRMLMLRARGFALRDKFSDVLKGLITREEADDMPPPDEQGPQSDLPWAGRLSEKKTQPPDDLTAAPDPPPDAAAHGDAASDSDSSSSADVLASEDEEIPPETSEWSEDEAASPSPFEDISPTIDLKGQRRLHACRSEGGHSEEATKAWLLAYFGVTSTKLVLQSDLHAICNRLRNPEPLPS